MTSGASRDEESGCDFVATLTNEDGGLLLLSCCCSNFLLTYSYDDQKIALLCNRQSLGSGVVH